MQTKGICQKHKMGTERRKDPHKSGMSAVMAKMPKEKNELKQLQSEQELQQPPQQQQVSHR
jgi:hypothetical protein